MVNVVNESCVDETTVIPSLSPRGENGDCSMQDICGRCPDEEAAPNSDSRGVPTPPSPVGSDSWQCSGSSAALLRVEALLSKGVSLPTILRSVCPDLREPPEGWSDSTVMGILSEILDQPPRRSKLPQYNTLEDAVELFRSRKRILILTGAGVSVSCGIPDFRSKNGIYARLHVDFPDLPDPTAMFDIRYFKQNPAPFYDFAKEIFPGQFEPSISHKFIRELEKNDQLLRNYTQNIDTLENQTGIERVVECHGSFSKATCQACLAKFHGDVIKEDVMLKRVAHCPKCVTGVIKPDIVFFGEDLGEGFHRQMAADKDQVDLVVVIGSSMKVRPVSLIPFSVDPSVPQILINREPLPSYTADIELLGNCDDVIRDICLALGGRFDAMINNHDERIYHLHPSITSTTNGDVVAPTVVVSLETAELSIGTTTPAESSTGSAPTPSNPTPATRKRRMVISSSQFTTMMEQFDQPKENGVSSATAGPSDSDEPETKRVRLESMFEQRYISIESKLPEHSYFQLSPNRAVFPGAELHYDLDLKMITRPAPHHSHETAYSSDDDDDDSGSIDQFDAYNGSGRGGSEPPDVAKAADQFHGSCSSSDGDSRPTSCDPTIDIEGRMTSFEMKRSLEDSNWGDDLESSDD